MPLRRALLSAVTLFGGHFLNRRQDRVAFIGILLVVAVIASTAQAYTLLGIGGVKFHFAAIWASRLPLILVLAIAVLSAGLTFRDARRSATGSLTTAIRIIRLPLTLVGTLTLAAAFRVAAISPTTWSHLQTDSNLTTTGHLYFGHGSGPIAVVIPNIGYQSPGPPDGPYPLRGRITLEGTGLEGVRILLTLNDEYIAVLYSDAHGNFETSLPAGKWRINEVTVSDWEGRPKSRPLALFSSNEPLKGRGLYSHFNYALAVTQGLEVSLPAAANAIPVELEFRYVMPITWPPVPGPGEGVPEKALSSGAIAWEAVEDASEYEVQISHMTSHDSMESPRLILTRRLLGLTLPLASLPQRMASAPADRYAVHVFAFDTAGRLLRESSVESENPLKSNDPMFQLTGATRLGREQQYVGFDGPVQVISAEYERNEERLDDARDLMRARRLGEARHLLEEVTQDAPPGRAWALRGSLAALQGDCKTALKLFDKADEEAGGGCAPSEERSLCPAP